MKHELTEWYPGHVKPVRDGVYQRDYGDKRCVVVYSKFAGGEWYTFGETVEEANHFPRCVTPYQSTPWRGIKK